MGDEASKIMLGYHLVLADGYKYLGGSGIFIWYLTLAGSSAPHRHLFIPLPMDRGENWKGKNVITCGIEINIIWQIKQQQKNLPNHHHAPLQTNREEKKNKKLKKASKDKKALNQEKCCQKRICSSVTDAQPGPKQLLLWLTSLPSRLIPELNVIRCGMSLWSFGISCPVCVPSSQLLVHPQPVPWWAEGRKGFDSVQGLLSNS